MSVNNSHKDFEHIKRLPGYDDFGLELIEHISTLPIMPTQTIVFPFQRQIFEIKEKNFRQMADDVDESDDYTFGLGYSADGKTLPPVGYIGCAAEIDEEMQKTDYISFVNCFGLARFEIEGYIETEKPYAVAKVAFFEDDEEDFELLRPHSRKSLELLKRFGNVYRREFFQNLPPEFNESRAYSLSFLVGRLVDFGVDYRLRLLHMRSTLERLQTVNERMERFLRSAEKVVPRIYQAENN
jgi:hypothetical protein